MKILLIRFSSIGDILVTTAVPRCIKEKYPESEVHYLTKRTYRPLLEYNTFIDRIYSIGDSVHEVMHALEEEHYTHIIDLHGNLRSFQVKQNLDAEVISPNKHRLKRFRIIYMKSDMEMKHRLQYYFDALDKLDVKYDGKGLDIFIPESEDLSPDKLPVTHCMGYYVLVLGATHYTKRPTPELCNAILSEIDAPFILLGGEDVQDLGEALAKKYPMKVINGCGKWGLLRSASMIKYAKVVITPDTGMMHIAAALRKKIIVLWGSTHRSLGMWPWQPDLSRNKDWEVRGLPCRPCHKHGRPACPKVHFKCIRDLNTEELKTLLAEFRVAGN